MADCNCIVCSTAGCAMECCARCIAYGFEVAMDEDKIRKGFYEGSQFVDYAYRDGRVSGLDKAYRMLKVRYPKSKISKAKREVYEELMATLLGIIMIEVSESNKWLNSEDPNNPKIQSSSLPNDYHG